MLKTALAYWTHVLSPEISGGGSGRLGCKQPRSYGHYPPPPEPRSYGHGGPGGYGHGGHGAGHGLGPTVMTEAEPLEKMSRSVLTNGREK